MFEELSRRAVEQRPTQHLSGAASGDALGLAVERGDDLAAVHRQQAPVERRDGEDPDDRSADPSEGRCLVS